jgi:hypothetical protein
MGVVDLTSEKKLKDRQAWQGIGPFVLLTHAPTSHAAGHTVVPPIAADSLAITAYLEKIQR